MLHLTFNPHNPCMFTISLYAHPLVHPPLIHPPFLIASQSYIPLDLSRVDLLAGNSDNTSLHPLSDPITPCPSQSQSMPPGSAFSPVHP